MRKKLKFTQFVTFKEPWENSAVLEIATQVFAPFS